MNEPTVFIVDDDAAFSESLAALLVSMGLHCQRHESGAEFLAQFDPTRPGVIMLDLRMPGIGGLAVQEQLRKHPLCPRIIVMSGYADVQTTIRALRQGAIDFLQKTVGDIDLREAIQNAVAKDLEVRREHERQSLLMQRFALLTQPERQVLELVISGQPNKTIATRLKVSQRAVEDRRARLMHKLSADSLPELVRFAIDAGMRPSQQLT